MAQEVQIKRVQDIMAQFVGFTAKKLPDDVIDKLKELRDKEDNPMAKTIYETMFRNQELAVKLNRPVLGKMRNEFPTDQRVGILIEGCGCSGYF